MSSLNGFKAIRGGAGKAKFETLGERRGRKVGGGGQGREEGRLFNAYQGFKGVFGRGQVKNPRISPGVISLSSLGIIDDLPASGAVFKGHWHRTPYFVANIALTYRSVLLTLYPSKSNVLSKTY